MRPQPVQVAYFAPSGKRFHKVRDCRGLRNANEIEGIAICQACQHQTQGQRPYSQTLWLYQDEVDRLHTDPTCGAVTGAMLEVRACSFCGRDGRLELRAQLSRQFKKNWEECRIESRTQLVEKCTNLSGLKPFLFERQKEVGAALTNSFHISFAPDYISDCRIICITASKGKQTAPLRSLRLEISFMIASFASVNCNCTAYMLW